MRAWSAGRIDGRGAPRERTSLPERCRRLRGEAISRQGWNDQIKRIFSVSAMLTPSAKESSADKHVIHCFVKVTKEHMCSLQRGGESGEGFTAGSGRREGRAGTAINILRFSTIMSELLTQRAIYMSISADGLPGNGTGRLASLTARQRLCDGLSA